MLALSIHQPKAILLLTGFCRLHTVSWTTGHRGKLFIHASHAMNDADRELLEHPRVKQHLESLNLKIVRGAIIGHVALQNTIAAERIWTEGNLALPTLTPNEWLTNNFESGTIMHFSAPTRTKPWYRRGEPGLFQCNQTILCA